MIISKKKYQAMVKKIEGLELQEKLLTTQLECTSKEAEALRIVNDELVGELMEKFFPTPKSLLETIQLENEKFNNRRNGNVILIQN